jgi:serine/threonine protein phosphatase PrpC
MNCYTGHIKSRYNDLWEGVNGVAEEILREVISEIEAKFIEFARDGYENGQLDMSVVNSGCLICILWRGKVYIVNVGGSRAVIVSHKGVNSTKRLHVDQIVRDHHCANFHVQEELAEKYRYDADDICIKRFGSIRVKGLSEVLLCFVLIYSTWLLLYF